jgi:phosphotransferase system  glucose/maltose/N-acetylglucosamine-specific IIC component
MQFTRNTSTRDSRSYLKLLIKVILVFVVIFVFVTLLNQIDLPSPNKKIEKVIPNENLKIVK